MVRARHRQFLVFLQLGKAVGSLTYGGARAGTVETPPHPRNAKTQARTGAMNIPRNCFSVSWEMVGSFLGAKMLPGNNSGVPECGGYHFDGRMCSNTLRTLG